MKQIKAIFSLILISLVITILYADSAAVYADMKSSDPYVIVSAYEVTDDNIIPGQEFELKLSVLNSDYTSVARDVLVSISCSDGITTVYPSVSQSFIGDMSQGEQRNLSFSFFAPTSISSDVALFYVTILSGSTSNYVVLSAPVKTVSSPFIVLATNVPDEIGENESVNSSLRFKVNSEDNLSNVEVSVYDNGEKIAGSSIGNMYTGATKTQNISFSLSETGKHTVLYCIEGMDTNGLVLSMDACICNINVVEHESVIDTEIENTTERKLSSKDCTIIVACSIAIVLCVGGIVFGIYKYR